MNSLLAFIPGLGMQEILLLGLCCFLAILAVVIPLIVIFIVNRKKKSEKQNQDQTP